MSRNINETLSFRQVQFAHEYLVQARHTRIQEEETVECVKCERRFHKYCANWPVGLLERWYICDDCGELPVDIHMSAESECPARP